MKKILWLIVFVPAFASSQVKYEVQEFTGTILSIRHRTIGIAYEIIQLNVLGQEENFSFHPDYAKIIIDNFKVGDQITVKANVNVTARAYYEKYKSEPKMREYSDLLARDFIAEIKVKTKWISLPEKKPQDYFSYRNAKIFLDKQVKDIYQENGDRTAFVFESGLIGTFWRNSREHINDIKKGETVSFIGSLLSGEEASYPLPNVKKVYFFGRLYKNQGIIKSFLYKQNYATIGMVLSTEDGDVKVSFPSNYATRLKKFADGGREVTIYRNNFTIPHQITPPNVHAIISERDTLLIEEHFYGGEDVAHDHRSVVVSGRITRINRAANERILSMILANDIYVEIDAGTADQILKYIRKGVEVEVSGDERIKKEGEIYQREYRIVTPRRVKIDQKEFLLR